MKEKKKTNVTKTPSSDDCVLWKKTFEDLISN